MEQLSCITPPKPRSKDRGDTIINGMWDSYERCKKGISPELHERQKTLATIRMEVNKISNIGKLEILTTKDLREVTITNRIDSLTFELGDGVNEPSIQLIGIVGARDSILEIHTFNSDDIPSLVRIAIVSLKLLELKRKPEKFGYKYVEFSSEPDGSITIQSDRGRVFTQGYLLGVNKEIQKDIFTFITSIFQGSRAETPTEPLFSESEVA